MNRFRTALHRSGLLLSDGGFGTMLQQSGLPAGRSPESFGDDHPENVLAIHRAYVDAGADIITTNTFGGTRPKLEPGMACTAFNRKMAEVAREAAGGKALVAGSIGPTGEMLRPLGSMDFSSAVSFFSEQITGLVQGGADFLLIQTQFDLGEARAAVIAARETCDLPVAVCMTFESGVSLTGTTPEVFVRTMENLGVDVLGTNCSAGPEEMAPVVERILTVSSTPCMAEANAGLPRLVNGLTAFPLGAEAFALRVGSMVDMGVRILGGCCGTTPQHIRVLRKLYGHRERPPLPSPAAGEVHLTSRTKSVRIGGDGPMVIVGERINPTGKKTLTAELQQGVLNEALRLAREQAQSGASVLDVNVGAAMVDEPSVMSELVLALGSAVTLPLCIDSTLPEAVQAGLAASSGSSLVNSISGEDGRIARLAPLCRRYGAPCILLPLTGGKLPLTAAERLAILENMIAECEAVGLPRRMCVVDGLALTVSSKPLAARECLTVIRECTEQWRLPTIVGLSNVSFGLPARDLVNSAFLCMAAAAGLSSCIANPGSSRLREAAASADVLLAADPQAERYIRMFAGWKESTGALPVGSPTGHARAETVGQAVVQGDRDGITGLVEKRLEEGVDPFELVDRELIPAINEVGELYERKEYFLPQLLLSAETMQTAFARLEPLLIRSGGQARRKILMATVQGDIHDIGKNIVVLMLRNQGYEVIDLGKDVPARSIADAATKEKASLVGLSALMTTTMVRMEEVVRLFKSERIPCKIMVGGAVLSEEFARHIQADGFARDAVGAVREAKRLLESENEASRCGE